MSFKKRAYTGEERISPVLVNSQNNPHISSATFVNIKIKDRKVLALIDSGAEMTLISRNLASTLQQTINPLTTPTRFVAANRQTIPTSGWTTLLMKLGPLNTTHKAIVVENLSTDLLLGTDWLKKNGADVNFGKNLLIIGSHRFDLLIKEKQSNFFVSTVREISLEPLSTQIEWFDLPKDFSGQVLWEYENTVRYLNIKSGLFEPDNHQIPLILENKNKFPIRIGKGKYLGTVEQIAHVSHVTHEQPEGQPSNEIKLDPKIGATEKKRLLDLVKRYEHICSKGEHDLGHSKRYKFEIQTENGKPIKSRPYRIPYAQQEAVDKMIDEMLVNKIISKSTSPWSSPVVIVKKKDGSDRFCVDYRKLNKITIRDNYPIPLIEETLDSLNGSLYFSTIDLASGYWQIALSDSAKEKTAFATHKGLFQFEVLPFGLSNAVSAFQRTMEIVLEGLPNCKVYVDDILIYSKTFEDHLRHLEAVFKRLEEANLKIKPRKCELGKSEVEFLGFKINRSGVTPNEQKTAALKYYPRPTNVKAVKRFLGMASYYRKFIPGFSTISEPINRLLKKENRFKWTPQCEDSFKRLLTALTDPPILSYPDFNKDFVLETDASTVGLGAVLGQKDPTGINKPIAYASRMLNNAERNYSATELECLAIVWATEQFRPYLYGRRFKIECDHNPLVYIDNMKNKNSRVSRWRTNLSEYTFEIIYKRGKMNVKADALSRAEPAKGETLEQQEENTEKVVISTNAVGSNTTQPDWWISIGTTPNEDALGSLDKLREAQENDPEVKRLRDCLPEGFLLEDGLLVRRSTTRNKLVIPETYKLEVLRLCHDGLAGGHLGFRKTWPKVRDRFYWRTMYSDTERYCKSCTPCAKRKSPKNRQSEFHPIGRARYPFQMLGVDILGPLTETKKGNKYVLVFTDYLSKWAEAFPLKKTDALTIAKIFVDEIVCRHSAPEILLSDQGAQFMSGLIKTLCSYLETRKLNTTAYHPQCNGLTERFNATLCQTLAIYCQENQTDWDDFIPTALFAYRTSIQETTQLSPFEVLFGRQPRLPSDLERFSPDVDENNKDFKKKWDQAHKKIRNTNCKRKEQFDKNSHRKPIEIGDSVRLFRPATKIGLKTKLRGTLWEGPYKVIGKYPNGNLKLNVGGKQPYTVNPMRVKLAEPEYEKYTAEPKRINPPKSVRFNDTIRSH